MEVVPPDGAGPGRWRNASGYRSYAPEDLPPSDGVGAQYFDYDAYAAEATRGHHHARDDGGDEMWYDAESQPFGQSGTHSFMQSNDAEYGNGPYNGDTWEHAPAPERSGRSFTETPAAYERTDTRQFHNDTDFSDRFDASSDHEDEAEADGDGDEEEEDGDERVLAAANESYYADDLLRSSLMPALPLNYSEQSADPTNFTSLGSLVNIDALNNDQRWEIDKESVAFLHHVVVDIDKDDTDLLLKSVQTSLRDLKVEEPVLLTDPQMDTMGIIERSNFQLKAEGSKPRKLNSDKDESLKWPAKYASLPAQLTKKLDSERLDLDVETIEYLKDMHGGPDIDLETWLGDERKRRAKPQCVSPKLLPMSPPYSPPHLPSQVASVPLFSTPEDPNEREVAELGKTLRERDDAAMQQLEEDSTYSSFGTNTDSSSSPLRHKTKRVSSLKVSDPVLPAEDVEPPAKKQKTVTFPEDLHTLIPQLPSSDADAIEAFDDSFAAVEQILEPLAAAATQQSENEELDEVDTTMRAAVPDVEAILPTPPWAEGRGDNLDPRRARPIRSVLVQAIDGLTKTEKKWSGVSRLERDLPWSAFASHLGKVRAEGEFDDGSAVRYIAELDDGDVGLERLTYRPEKLQLLIVDEFDDDELEPLDLEDDDFEQVLSEPDILPGLPAPTGLPRPLVPETTITPAFSQKVPSQPLVDHKLQCAETSSFDAMLRRRKEELEHAKEHSVRPEQPSIVPATPHLQIEKQQTILGGGLTQHLGMQGISDPRSRAPSALAVHDKAPAPVQLKQNQQQERTATSAPTASVPLPSVGHVETTLPVVISSAMMKTSQQLVRGIQKLLPTLDIIERSYNAKFPHEYNSATIAGEADMTISPGTGLMFTNLQKLKQKPLPGQSSHFGIRQQISLVAPRYERLIVFVSGGTAGTGDEPHIQHLDESDTSALTDLVGFATTLDCEVEVIYTAGGNTELARWTAAMIAQHAHGHSGFLTEETTWERFLRRAGMNTYSAQVLLEQLKPTVMAPYSDSSHTQSSPQCCAFGLGAFVAMSAEERVYRFTDVLGGWRVLQRVSEMIDGPLIPVQQHR